MVVDGCVDGFQTILAYCIPKLGGYKGDKDEEQSGTGQGHQRNNVMLVMAVFYPSKAQCREEVSEESQSQKCNCYLSSQKTKQQQLCNDFLLHKQG